MKKTILALLFILGSSLVQAEELIGNFREAFLGEEPVEGWGVFFNEGGPVDDPSGYIPMTKKDPDPARDLKNPFYSAHEDFPGPSPYANAVLSTVDGIVCGGLATADFTRYTIVSYNVSNPGHYKITNSRVTTLSADGNRDIIILCAGKQIQRQIIDGARDVSVDQDFGVLSAGDTISVAFGPGTDNEHAGDTFVVDFDIVRE